MPPPGSEEELFIRAKALAGRPLAALADEVAATLPSHIGGKKGSVGQLIEWVLGADGRSHPRPDFGALGIELKTIPIGGKGDALESMFVCSVSFDEVAVSSWSTCRVRAKLQRVLLLPIESGSEIPLGSRRVGHPLLWSPSPAQEELIRQDWEDLADLIAHGYSDHITARRGRVLQLRPKAKDGRVRRKVSTIAGDEFLAHPRGFYLRRAFINSILSQHYAG